MDEVGTFNSYADAFVVNLPDALNIERRHLVATSLGGYFAHRAAAAHPALAPGRWACQATSYCAMLRTRQDRVSAWSKSA